MTIEEYYAQIKNLGLRPSHVPGTYWDVDSLSHNVRDPTDLTPEQRAEIIEKMKERMGIGWRH